MTDIVERLRIWCADWQGQPTTSVQLMIEAAKEIELLRSENAALREQGALLGIEAMKKIDEFNELIRKAKDA